MVRSAQKFINALEPKVNVHVPPESPLPSIGELKQFSKVVSVINGLEPAISALSDEELKAKTGVFRQGYKQAIAKEKNDLVDLQKKYLEAKDQTERDEISIAIDAAKLEVKKSKQKYLSSILPEAFAIAREAGKRILKMRHFDVQLVGGMVLNGGNIAEMTTGEGKTLVATLPAYLNGLTGEGVHVVTVNDYLAKRDRDWMGPLYEFLGLSVGVIQHDMSPAERQREYGCDITYGTNNEFGFDYLRDNMVIYKEDMVQRGHYFAIVDEVDSILVDEARTPLIISGPAEEATDIYYRADKIVYDLHGRRLSENDIINAKAKGETLEMLSKGYDYTADEKNKSVSLTESGEEKISRSFGISNLHDMDTMQYRHHILQAIKAHEFFKIDVDYVVKEKEVMIVDEFTGRLMPGRRWSDGLHQAVEAKEGMKIERENQTLATVTFQNYFRLYEKLSGMTGTAYTEAVEFKQIYKLDCVVIPTNKPIRRRNFEDQIYRSVREKFNAVVLELEEFHKRGQPVLVGTISIEKSEYLSKLLKNKGIPHQILNAKFHELEAHIIAQAGRYKAVTIATNMAGRGTDIVLGGNPVYLAKQLVAQKMQDDKDADQEAMIKKFIEQFTQQCAEENKKVLEAGGLHVLGTERHESRRIDNQLRGRQGRQGDPGSSKFFVSFEDDLMRLFGSERMIGIMNSLGVEEGQVLDHPILTKQIEVAQKRVEAHNFEIRKHLLEYDNVMNKQREVIYSLRRDVLERESVKDLIFEAVDNLVFAVVRNYLFSEKEDAVQDVDGLEVYLRDKFGLVLGDKKSDIVKLSHDEATDFIVEELKKVYAQKEQQLEPEHLRYMEKMLFLRVIDSRWKDHLYAMDQMREGIGLRSYAQKDPLVEYKKEGFAMFEQMYDAIHEELAEIIFRIQMQSRQTEIKGVFSAIPQHTVHQDMSSLSSQGGGQPGAMPDFGGARHSAPVSERREGPKVGRNDPCPCGSGKKFKKCCGNH
ncbi:MAG: preprotein translocase subunit SecA [Candidatus Omnitrophica bacterium]|nr:preprotein translocase subunit SecA [Candidatus Omnitrophota bacterium]